jgi:hypothetical protein
MSERDSSVTQWLAKAANDMLHIEKLFSFLNEIMHVGLKGSE